MSCINPDIVSVRDTSLLCVVRIYRSSHVDIIPPSNQPNDSTSLSNVKSGFNVYIKLVPTTIILFLNTDISIISPAQPSVSAQVKS